MSKTVSDDQLFSVINEKKENYHCSTSAFYTSQQVLGEMCITKSYIEDLIKLAYERECL